MFDVSADDIALLNDIDLRELVGRLCEAELASRGLSTAAVTWGGNQTAADGGLDVRVALPKDTLAQGYVPRASTGFQVKTPDMARAAILTEMRPDGSIRPVIQDLASEDGAYVIVSSHGSVADTALSNRRTAMREALNGVEDAARLHTDFYDRTRLASWVRQHPGLIAWVRTKVGRALAGWRPFGAWTGGSEDIDAEYLLDDRLRLHLGGRHDESAQSIESAIDELRDVLAQPGKRVRLVGLSGVGKTRFVQALFDGRIGSRPLSPSLAVYSNLSDNPNPQPTGLASDLIANRSRAILIVDNCPSDLHRRLSEVCGASDSLVSVLTVEYDVRDDQPEGTQVVTLTTSSPALIEKLIRRRFSHLSEVNARTIADASGGNARIAIALAETVDRSESLADLSDDELFQRLFRQRNDPNDALLLAAQACSLVYSFDGEATEGDEAEMPRLAVLAEQTPREIYRHVGELLRRDLAQPRGVWRAILPHAIANRLAARALEDIPYNVIDQQLLAGGTSRLARSFSRRLSFLHEHPRAVSIVDQWLSTAGMLGDVTQLNPLGQAIFENVAPVSPDGVLAALERARDSNPGLAALASSRHRLILRSLAHDPLLFERSAALLELAATEGDDERELKEAASTFVSLFAIHLSGTHATIQQRLQVIERLLRSNDSLKCTLGLSALKTVLKTTRFSSHHSFEFGARPRDYGYLPKSDEEVTEWYGAALTLIERLAFTDGLHVSDLGRLLSHNFRGLWTAAHMSEQLAGLVRRFAASRFWREAWVACRQTLRFDRDRLSPAAFSRLTELEVALSPIGVSERVRALVLGDRVGGLDLEDMDLEADPTKEYQRLEASASELGATVALDPAALAELLPELLQGGNRTWSFGRGLAAAATDKAATWSTLVEGLEQLPMERCDVQVLRGYLSQIWVEDRNLAHRLLDEAFTRPALATFLPTLHSAMPLDEPGVARLKRVLMSGQAPINMYQNLARGSSTHELAATDFRDLLLLISEQSDGYAVAIEMMVMRLFADRSAKRKSEADLLEVGRQLLQRVRFTSSDGRDYKLAEVASACLAGPKGAAVAREIVIRLTQAVAAGETYSFVNPRLMGALLAVQPLAVLDALFDRNINECLERSNFLRSFHDHEDAPADGIPSEVLIAWCDQDRQNRFTLAASFVTFAKRAEGDGSLTWSDHAKQLLAHAPNPADVLGEFVHRFCPTGWSGSRASLMEMNGRLLDSLEEETAGKLAETLAATKEQFARRIVQERQWETETDRSRDERFE